MNGEVQYTPPYTVRADDIKLKTEKKDISVGNWLLTFLILIIPIFNIIMLCVWSFSEKINASKRNFCRAVLLISIVLSSIVISLLSFAAVMNFYFFGG